LGLTPSSALPSLSPGETHLYGNLPYNKMHQKNKGKKLNEKREEWKKKKKTILND
jgi:hypothetical protein